MPVKPKIIVPTTLVAEWTLPPAAMLGSSVRARGILLEARAKLSLRVRKWLDIKGSTIALRVPEGIDEDVAPILASVARTMDGVESLPVIPRELEDILAIKTSERHRWLKDGRLHSAGTRTVKLRGRARKITFHVFDPRWVEDVLDRDLVSAWREDDVITAAENRRRGRENAALKRALRTTPIPPVDQEAGPRPKLKGWEEFEREGLLR